MEYRIETQGQHFWASRSVPQHKYTIWGRGDSRESAIADCEATILEVLTPEKGDPVQEWHQINTRRPA